MKGSSSSQQRQQCQEHQHSGRGALSGLVACWGRCRLAFMLDITTGAAYWALPDRAIPKQRQQTRSLVESGQAAADGVGADCGWHVVTCR